jgi:hypothetical protein
VTDEPPDHVRELRGILHPLDVGDRLVLADLPGVEVARVQHVEPHVVAEERVRPEPGVADPHQVDAVLEVVHHALERMPRVRRRDRRVRGTLDPDHPARFRDRLQQVVLLQLAFGEQRSCARVR